MSEIDSNEDIRRTLLYRNARAVERSLEETNKNLSEIRQELVLAQNRITMQNQELADLTQRVNTMFASAMGTGGTSGDNS